METPSQGSPAGKTNIIFVILFEVFFVALLLFIILGLLNFFNVISLNQFLSFLPQKSPAPVAQFTYPTTTASDTLSKYIRNVVNGNFMPSQIDVLQGLIDKGSRSGTTYEFGYHWTNGLEFQADFHYVPNTNTIRDMEIGASQIGAANLPDKVTQDYASGLVSKYFAPPSLQQWMCDTISQQGQTSTTSATVQDLTKAQVQNPTTIQISYCESFDDKAPKKGFGVFVRKDLTNSANNVLNVFTCLIPNGSPYLTSRHSCLLFKDQQKK